MQDEIGKMYSNLLETIIKYELYHRNAEHDDLIIEELHIIRDSDGIPIGFRSVSRYLSAHTGP